MDDPYKNDNRNQVETFDKSFILKLKLSTHSIVNSMKCRFIIAYNMYEHITS